MGDLNAVSVRPTVPFVNLGPSHEGLKAEILAEISDLIDAGAFTNGAQVQAFEDAFARYCGTNFCVGVSSGLDGLRLALQAAGIEAGDEVIVPAMTFVATYEAVTQAGGIPVPVDISHADYCIDPQAVETAIGRRTTFILPVHLYGQLANMRALQSIAEQHGILLIEDACQAHGAERDGVRAGAGATAAGFSFYPGKNLGAMGDAGAVTTNDATIAAELRVLREHGQDRKYEHRREGWTARLDTIQALVLLQKLAMLDEWNTQRRDAAAFYLHALTDVGDITLPPSPAESDPVWHLFVIRTSKPSQLAEYLFERGIRTARHYPVPPPRSEAYADYGFGRFPVAERLAKECLSLPLFPGITEEHLDAVVRTIGDFF